MSDIDISSGRRSRPNVTRAGSPFFAHDEKPVRSQRAVGLPETGSASTLSANGTSSARYSRWTSSGPSLSRSEEHTSELQSLAYLVCRLLLEKKKKKIE